MIIGSIFLVQIVKNETEMKNSFIPSMILHYLKSVNLQNDTLGCLDDGTNESSTKSLIFQALFFS